MAGVQVSLGGKKAWAGRKERKEQGEEAKPELWEREKKNEAKMGKEGKKLWGGVIGDSVGRRNNQRYEFLRVSHLFYLV